VCPTRTFADEPMYDEGDAPSRDEVAQRIAAFFDPYHQTLAAELERVRALHGYAVLLDGHSIRAEVPRFFAGRLPDLNLGTADGASCDAALAAVAAGALADHAAFSQFVIGRFKVGYVTRHYGRPEHGVHTLQLEMAQCAYMDEAPPFGWDAGR